MPIRLERIIRGVAGAMRAECELIYDFCYSVTVNDVHMAAVARQVATRIVGEQNVLTAGMSMGAEDMSYFLQAVPGYYLLLGSGSPDKSHIHSHHSNLFDFDKAALSIGIELLTQVTLASLTENTQGH